MYQKSDRVFYIGVGVCEIEDIESKTILNETREYYRLRPMVGQNAATFFLPILGAEKKLRSLLSAKEVEGMVSDAVSKPLPWIENDRERQNSFRQILKAGDQRQLLRLIIALHDKQEEKANLGKRLWAAEEGFLKDGEEQLHLELSCTLKITPDEVTPYLLSHLRKAATN